MAVGGEGVLYNSDRSVPDVTAAEISDTGYTYGVGVLKFQALSTRIQPDGAVLVAEVPADSPRDVSGSTLRAPFGQRWDKRPLCPGNAKLVLSLALLAVYMSRLRHLS